MSTSKNYLGVFNTKHKITLGPSNSVPRYIPNRNTNLSVPKDANKTVIAALFIITPYWEQLSCLLTE